jgi:hypothetical protein
MMKGKERELRELAKNLYWYDYLNYDEMKTILDGGSLDKERIREWDKNNDREIKF